MDCFEGGLGFGVDMGLIGINYGTLERVPRKSFYFYQEVIKHHGLL
jgi:beta-glucosidase/6-phospho-beta-glucosidase/beta-galactosidase